VAGQVRKKENLGILQTGTLLKKRFLLVLVPLETALKEEGLLARKNCQAALRKDVTHPVGERFVSRFNEFGGRTVLQTRGEREIWWRGEKKMEFHLAEAGLLREPDKKQRVPKKKSPTTRGR